MSEGEEGYPDTPTAEAAGRRGKTLLSQARSDLLLWLVEVLRIILSDDCYLSCSPYSHNRGRRPLSQREVLNDKGMNQRIQSQRVHEKTCRVVPIRIMMKGW